MATSGTANFNLDFVEIAEEAFERAGKEMRSGYELRTARRSLNLLMLEWQNRGLNMFTIDEGSIPLVSGTATYDLPADTIDLLDHVIRTTIGVQASDLVISRISVSTYASIPTKTTLGRPVQLWVERRVDAPRVTLWPVPNLNATYSLRYWRMRRIQDAGTGSVTPDVNARFLPAMTAGLAYHIAIKLQLDPIRLQLLKAEYEQSYQLASEEDREKAPVRLVPRIRM